MEKMKDRKPASSDVSGANDLGDADSVMLSAHPSSNDAPGEIRGQPHTLAKFMNAAGLVTLDTFPVQSPSFARISPFLILGDYHTSASLETLRAENVVAVVNATTEVACHFPTLLAYLRVPVHDDMHEDLLVFVFLSNACSHAVKYPLSGTLTFLQASVSSTTTVSGARCWFIALREGRLFVLFPHVVSIRFRPFVSSYLWQMP